jgi:hypothetical protein
MNNVDPLKLAAYAVLTFQWFYIIILLNEEPNRIVGGKGEVVPVLN